MNIVNASNKKQPTKTASILLVPIVRTQMPMVPKLAFINSQMRRTVVMLRHQRRRLCLFARRIANLLVLPDPAFLRHMLAIVHSFHQICLLNPLKSTTRLRKPHESPKTVSKWPPKIPRNHTKLSLHEGYNTSIAHISTKVKHFQTISPVL